MRANGVAVGPDQGLDERARCSTTATCCCARASARTTWSRFLRAKVDARDPASIVFLFALGTGNLRPEQARHQRRTAAHAAAETVRAESFGSLKTEEKTNASAGSESTTFGSTTTLSVNFGGRFPSVTNNGRTRVTPGRVQGRT